MPYRTRTIRIMTRGFTHVCRKVKDCHRRNQPTALRLLRCRRGGSGCSGGSWVSCSSCSCCSSCISCGSSGSCGSDGSWGWRLGDAEGDAKVGVGSRVDNAEAPLSPLRLSPTVLDVRRERGRGIISLSFELSGRSEEGSTAVSRVWKVAMIAEKKEGGRGNFV